MDRQKETNVKLDLLKGCACIGVVFIHVSFPGTFGQIVNYISTFAVPVFYMIAGYFAWGKGTDTVKRRLLKILKLLLWGYALFFAYCTLSQLLNGTYPLWLQKNFNRFTPVKYLVFCTVDFAVPLWYLIAMAELYVLWYFVVKHQKEQLALRCMPVLFALLVLSTACCEAMGLPWFWKINFLTQGLSWFLLGYFLRTPKADALRNLTAGNSLLLAAGGCILAVLPTVTALPYSAGLIGQIPYALGLFLLALKDPGRSHCKGLEYTGKYLSLYIYLLHTPAAGVLAFLCRRLLGTDTEAASWLWIQPLLTVVCTVFAAWVLHLFSRCLLREKVCN